MRKRRDEGLGWRLSQGPGGACLTGRVVSVSRAGWCLSHGPGGVCPKGRVVSVPRTGWCLSQAPSGGVVVVWWCPVPLGGRREGASERRALGLGWCLSHGPGGVCPKDRVVVVSRIGGREARRGG